jgi:carbonic anhydrase
MMGVGPDEVLELRNLANLAPTTDASTRSCIELALQQGVEHLIVCGHYGCRACAMALHPPVEGALTPWLSEVRELYRHYEGTLDALQGADRARHVVELNVRTQVMHILELPVIQLRLQDDRGPQLHGWVFDPVTGKIRDLNLDIGGLLERVQRVYRLRGTS